MSHDWRFAKFEKSRSLHLVPREICEPVKSGLEDSVLHFGEEGVFRIGSHHQGVNRDNECDP